MSLKKKIISLLIIVFFLFIFWMVCWNNEITLENEIRSIDGYENMLYVPTMINKFDDMYFIVDCWQHRVLYNDKMDESISEWKTLTDESYVGGHSIASDGDIFVLDNTDSNQILAYRRNTGGKFEKIKTIGNIVGRPHYVIYDDKSQRFYVIGSLSATIYVFENQESNLVLVQSVVMKDLEDSYVRSINIIDGFLYTVSGNKAICKYRINESEFQLEETYEVPEEFYGMNQIVKIQDYYYLTINTDINGDLKKTNILRTKNLNGLAEGEYESLYKRMGFVGQPYFITSFDNHYYVTQISETRGNGIKSFDIVDNEIKNETDEFYWENVSEDSINRYRSKYGINELQIENVEVVDLFVFCGQSNMAGKGDAALAPKVEYGYEFRAVTDSNNLYQIYEPFGIDQNNENGINDIWPETSELRKTGGLVSAFANAYYKETNIPIVGVSCSEGATVIEQWMPGTNKYEDIVQRCNLAKEYINISEYFTLRHTYFVWAQGESDGDIGTDYITYYDALDDITTSLCQAGVVEKCMIIEIGNKQDNGDLYQDIRKAQNDLCKDSKYCILISRKAQTFFNTGLMKDEYHYTQEGYNLLGEDAGRKAALYSNSVK